MYCHPSNYKGVFPMLFNNDGEGVFRDVAAEAGLQTFRGKGLGVVAADFDNDGWVDIFFANDSVRNLLFHNRQDGSFEDVTFSSGVGYSARISDLAPLTARVYTLTRRSATISPPERGGG